MKQTLHVIFMLVLLTACGPKGTTVAPQTESASTLQAGPVTGEPSAGESSAESREVDILANLAAPNCDSGLTPGQTEGPYYLAGAPERTSLIEANTQGQRLILAGYVVNQDCFTIPHARLDFWQADANGKYDLAGFSLRGFQYADNKGRFYLETVLPGIYESRPIRHIHVKVQAPNGQVLTTQLYFPEQPIEGLTVTLEQRDGFLLAIFVFVVGA